MSAPNLPANRGAPTQLKPSAKPFWKRVLRNVRRNASLLLAELTVGFPFIGYKFLAGLLCLSMLDTRAKWLIGGAFLGLAAIDLLLNAVNLGALVFLGRRILPVCFLSWAIGRTPQSKRSGDLGEALDVMLSFGIVACVVGINLFPQLMAISMLCFYLWNACTVTNVLGAGIARMAESLRRRHG
jgi:hypothetical protein